MNIIKNYKKQISYILLFIIIFIITLIVSYIINPLWGDQVWSYGFSYYISKGLIMYRDFNTIQMPLYFILDSVFIKIFGNYLIAANIFDSLLITTIGVILIHENKWKGIIPLLVLQLLTTSQYNIMCLLFLFIILYLISNNKDNDYLIAYILGLTFITKQNIGVLLFIPFFFYSKNKIKSIIVFLIPFIVLCIFFLINNSIVQFLDYTIFGILAFNSNKYIIPSLLVVQIINSLYLIYHLIKSKFQDKEAFYILIFQLISYPSGDITHVVPTVVAFLYYFNKHSKFLILRMTLYMLIIVYTISAYYYQAFPIDINTKKDLFFLKSPASITNHLEEIYNYFDRDLTNVYIASEYSYLLKMYYNYPVNEYDQCNDGNWGYLSEDKIINNFIKECKEKDCKFLIRKDIPDHFQIKTINKILEENFKIIDEHPTICNDCYIYGNKKDD